MERTGWMKSGSQGWIKVNVLEDVEFTRAPGGVVVGPGMGHTKVYVLEGKHAGDTIDVPRHYVTFTRPRDYKPVAVPYSVGSTMEWETFDRTFSYDQVAKLARQHGIPVGGTKGRLFDKLKRAGVKLS